MASNNSVYWKELIGRATMVVFAAALAAGATFLVMGGVGGFDYSPSFGVVMVLGGTFLYLVAGTLFCFAFFPAGDTAAEPPRGFVVVSAIFNGFERIAKYLFTGFGRY